VHPRSPGRLLQQMSPWRRHLGLGADRGLGLRGEGAVPASVPGEPQAGRALPLKKRMRESGVPEAQGGEKGYPGAEGTGVGRLAGRRGTPRGPRECARIVRCLHLLKQFISKCEGRMQRSTQPHGASFLGPSFTLHVSMSAVSVSVAGVRATGDLLLAALPALPLVCCPPTYSAPCLLSEVGYSVW